MDGNASNARSAANQAKPIVGSTDGDLVELLWHNGSVVAQSQRAGPSDRGASGSGLTGEETAAAAWFPDTLDGALEGDLYAQVWHSIAGGGGAATIPDSATFAHPPPDWPPMRSGGGGVGSSRTGDIGSTLCCSSQVPEMPADGREGAAALPPERPDGAGTSSSGGSGSNFAGSGLPPIESAKRKGRGRDDSDSRSEDAECEATEETKSSSRKYGSKRRSRAAEVHNMSERRRRDRINEKMRSLQELIPHCNKTDKASILDEAIEYLKSLQMQLQIMWMSAGMAPVMFPGAHQFMPPMSMNSVCMPAAHSLNQMPRLPYMNHSMPNHIPMNSSLAMNPLNVANQMQNIHLREASNDFTHPDGRQTAAPQVSGLYASGLQVVQQNEIPNKVPATSTVVPNPGAEQVSASEGI